MWTLPRFKLDGFRLDMYPGDHFPEHFHLSCEDFDIRILYLISARRRTIIYSPVWQRGKVRNKAPLNSQQKRILLNLIDTHLAELNTEWIRLHE